MGSQPFGGEGLSGTDPKAAGPDYVPRFTQAETKAIDAEWAAHADEKALLQVVRSARPAKISEQLMPGPTGELNRLSLHTRPPVLCLGPGVAAAAHQVVAVEALGGQAVAVGGSLAPEALTKLPDLSVVLWWGDAETARHHTLR